jgi:anti-sigma B factor antagonist
MTAQMYPPPALEAPILRIEIAEHPDRVELHLVGELDLSTRGLLESTLARDLPESVARVRLDLSGLDFCDATGLAELLAARRAASRRSLTLASQGVRPQVLRLLELTGTSYVLDNPAD